jgi:hypothetical protein
VMRIKSEILRDGLLWTGLLLAVLAAVTAVAAGGLETSWAAPAVVGARAASLGLDQDAGPSGGRDGGAIAYTGVVSYYAYLPAMFKMKPPILLQDDFNAGISQWTPFLNYPARLEEGQWYWGPQDGVGGSGALTHDCCAGPTGKVASDALMMYLGDGAEDWTDYRVETKLLLRGGVDRDGNPEPNSGDPIGLWVRGHYQQSDTHAQWVDGYYVVVAGKSDGPEHWVRLAQMQIPGDCTTACNRPQNQYAFNNPFPICDPKEAPGPGCNVTFSGPFVHGSWYTLAVEVRGNHIKVWLDGVLALDYVDEKLPFLTGTVGYKVHETQTASFDDILVRRLD